MGVSVAISGADSAESTKTFQESRVVYTVVPVYIVLFTDLVQISRTKLDPYLT